MINYTNVDGYYEGWTPAQIAAGGFQGTDARTITGYDSDVVYNLVEAASKINPKDYYNGHYTGTAMNSGESTTQIKLSPDAGRYIANNFGTDAGIYEWYFD